MDIYRRRPIDGNMMVSSIWWNYLKLIQIDVTAFEMWASKNDCTREVILLRK